LPSSRGRSKHIKLRLAQLDEALFAKFPLANEVREWITTSIAADERCCASHGDLLPQNLLCEWPGTDQLDTPIGVVDWEMSRVGDPAYDLAIVSRGNRKVFGISDGLKILVGQYLEAGSRPIGLADVRSRS